MGGVGLGGVASFLGIFAMNGALVGSLFGAFGGKMTGEMVDAYAKEVSDFKFIPAVEEWGEFGTKEAAALQGRRLRVTVGINGWLDTKEDVMKPWRVLGRDTEVFALRYEMEALLTLGQSLQNMVSSYAWSFIKLEILKKTVLATLWSAIWPVYLLKMATSIDSPFALARDRSEKAGEVLADTLINKAQGERPVTLIGYSLGSRVIYSCKSLAKRKAFGLVESVVFIGSPVPSNSKNWRVMRSVVSGNVTNVYSENDYILAFLYRATSIQYGIAGLQAIADIEGIMNLDLSQDVSGHLRYPELIGQILKRAGFEGVLVENANIETDAKEIQLLDFEQEEAKAGETSSLHQGDFLESMDSEPAKSQLTAAGRRQGKSENMDALARGTAGLGVKSTVVATTEQPQAYQTASMGHLAELTGSTSLETASKSASHITPLVHHHDIQSESDDGGIQMIDNDSDSDGGSLHELPGVPIPDDEPHPSDRQHSHEVDPRNSEKVAAFEEQKSLGCFPKARGESSITHISGPSTSR